MIGARRPLTDEDLSAYVDGEIDPDRRSEVESALAADTEAAAKVAAYRRQVQALHELFDPVLAEPTPGRLTATARARPRRPALARIAWRAAAAVALVALGGGLGWSLRGTPLGETPQLRALVDQAALAHVIYVPEVRHPVEVEAKEEAHLVGWLSKRMGATIRAPKLGSLGYQLVGGRMLPDPSGPAAQFMYQDTNGRRVTLYVRLNRSARTTAFRFATDLGVELFYWLDGPLGYALVGEMDREALMRLAHAVYEDLNRGGRPPLLNR